MEGVKSLIMCMLVLGLVLQQEKIQVEAKSCCPSTTARNVYNSCRFAGGSRDTCAKLSGCKIVDGNCKPPYVHHTLHPEAGKLETLTLLVYISILHSPRPSPPANLGKLKHINSLCVNFWAINFVISIGTSIYSCIYMILQRNRR